MLLYFIFIIFGILLFLIFNHINNFSIGGLNYRLYEYENDVKIIEFFVIEYGTCDNPPL